MNAPCATQRPTWFFPALALVLILQVALAVAFGWVGDDAYIAFRYARNLAAGEGLRFNPGTHTPVEGYTQLLWVLVVALIERAGLEVVTATRTVEIACGVLLMACVTRWAWRNVSPTCALWTALLFATAPTVVVWSSGGLGTMLFALVVFTSATNLWSATTPTSCAALVCLLVTLVRFDGLYFVGALLAATLVAATGWTPRGRAARGGSSRAVVRRAWICVGVVAVGFALQTLWRLGYHGDFLPNTARAKVSFGWRPFERGLDYLLAHWMAIPTSLATLVAAPVLLWRRSVAAEPGTGRTEADFRRSGFLWTGFLLCLATFAYGVLTSGDFMAMWRFFLPAMAFLALFAGLWIDRIGRTGGPLRRRSVRVLLAAALLLGWFPALFAQPPWPRALLVATKFRWRIAYQPEHEFLRGDAERGRHWANLGRALALHTTEGESLVAEAVGAVGYHTRLTLFDRFGLVDREVARTIRADPAQLRLPGHDTHAPLAFFADREPTYVMAELRSGEYPGTPLYDAFVAQADASLGRVLLFAVHAEDGFEEDGTLLLVRYDSDHARAVDAADLFRREAIERERARRLLQND
ncbi:hypothetical protein [Planctomycetes bacterium Pla163]|uniref:hypothetical protein n=1 Tax=Rohdeia mirabilis TaxID=2528008 RepID=UPI0011A025EE